MTINIKVHTYYIKYK